MKKVASLAFVLALLPSLSNANEPVRGPKPDPDFGSRLKNALTKLPRPGRRRPKHRTPEPSVRVHYLGRTSIYLYTQHLRSPGVRIKRVERLWTTPQEKAGKALDEELRIDALSVDMAIRRFRGASLASTVWGRTVQDNGSPDRRADRWRGTARRVQFVFGHDPLGRALPAPRLAYTPISIRLEAISLRDGQVIGSSTVLTTQHGFKHMVTNPLGVRDVALGGLIRRKWLEALGGIPDDPRMIEFRAILLRDGLARDDGKELPWFPEIPLDARDIEPILSRDDPPPPLSDWEAQALQAALEAWKQNPELVDADDWIRIHRLLGRKPDELTTISEARSALQAAAERLERNDRLLDENARLLDENERTLKRLRHRLDSPGRRRPMGDRLPFQD